MENPQCHALYGRKCTGEWRCHRTGAATPLRSLCYVSATSRRCTSGDVLLSPKGHAALTTIPRLDVDLCIVKAAHLGRQPLTRRLLILHSMACICWAALSLHLCTTGPRLEQHVCEEHSLAHGLQRNHEVARAFRLLGSALGAVLKGSYQGVNLACQILLLLLYKPLDCLRFFSLIIDPLSVPVTLLSFRSCGNLCIDTRGLRSTSSIARDPDNIKFAVEALALIAEAENLMKEESLFEAFSHCRATAQQCHRPCSPLHAQELLFLRGEALEWPCRWTSASIAGFHWSHKSACHDGSCG